MTITLRRDRLMHGIKHPGDMTQRVEVNKKDPIRDSIYRVCSTQQAAADDYDIKPGHWLESVTMGGMELSLDESWEAAGVEEDAVIMANTDSVSLRVLVLGGGEV